MGDINVNPGDSRDELGLERFHPLSYESMWNIQPLNRTFKHARFPLKKVFQLLNPFLFQLLKLSQNIFAFK